METVAPLGATYQAGTLSGNPLAMAAGIATLQVLAEPGVYERLEERAQQVCQGLVEAALGAGVPTTLNRVGAMMTLFFCEGPVTELQPTPAGPTRRSTRATGATCSSTACTWRRRSSSRPWSRSRSPTPTWPSPPTRPPSFFKGL